jgi:hypothetical protein
VTTGAGTLWINNVVLTQTSAALGIDAFGNPTIAAQGVSNAMIQNAAVQSANIANAAITNALLAVQSVATANLQNDSVTYLQVASVLAQSVEADYSTLGDLMAGNVTIALNLSVGGAVRFASGSVIVAINDPYTGHAFVASSTAGGGATTVLDGGYVNTFSSFSTGFPISYVNTVAALLGQQVIYGGATSWAFTMSDTVATSYGTVQSIAQTITNWLNSVFTLSYESPVPGIATNTSIVLAATAVGTWLQLSPSFNTSGGALVPGASPGVIFVGTTNGDTGTHLYVCLGSGFTKIV